MVKKPRDNELPEDWDDNPEWTEANSGPPSSATMLKAARVKLGLNQAEAAALLEVPLGTLRGWEQKRFEPEPGARTLIRLLYQHPNELRAWLSAA